MMVNCILQLSVGTSLLENDVDTITLDAVMDHVV